MIKQRYRILLFEVILTIILYLVLQLTYSIKTPEAGTIITIIESVLDIVAYVHIYLLINLLWIGFIIIGVVKKNKEFVLGGIYSLIFSFGLIALILGS